MPYDLKYNGNLRIIELVHTGILSGKDLQKCTEEGIALQMEHGVYAILIDTIDLESVANIADLYYLPRQYDEGKASRSTRIALVTPRDPAAQGFTQFYDNVCNNRGWRVQPFDTRDEAVEWLTSNESS